MRNSECVIYIATRRGRTWAYARDRKGWTQTGPTGTMRRLTAEQLLSHLLPPLVAGGQRYASVRVERRGEVGASAGEDPEAGDVV